MAADPLIRTLADAPDSEVAMPALFVGHGSPMNAIEDNEFSRAWAEAAKSLPRPRAILCISAHWETIGTQVTAMERPRTIHDFYGFPEPLYAKQYPAPGAPGVARLAQDTVRKTQVALDFDWGLDHGAWSVLCRMFPQADVPAVQLSLDGTQEPAHHYALGRELKGLRQKGVLIVGSGNMVHNLRQIVWQDTAYDWALEFDAKLKQLIQSGDHDAIIHYQKLGQAACLAVPTNEHYLPLLYVLALQGKGDEVRFFADKVTLGSMSMRSVRVG
jgi:4,5-DOPA dioxygenase extradiol